METTLARLELDLDELFRPRESRAVFAPLSGSERIEIGVALPLETRVEVRSRPVLLPLVEALSQSPPAGIIGLSRERARVLTSCAGDAAELLELDLSEDSADWRDMSGPASHSLGVPGFTRTGHSELYERRRAFAREVAATVEARAERDGWQIAVLLGDPRFTGELAEQLSLPELVVRVVHDHAEDWQSASAVAAAAHGEIADAQAARHCALAQRIIDESRSGGRGALGVDDADTLLDAGRVEHLVVALRSHALTEADRSRIDPIVARALTASVPVTALGESAGLLLAPYGPVGALLRF